MGEQNTRSRQSRVFEVCYWTFYWIKCHKALITFKRTSQLTFQCPRHMLQSRWQPAGHWRWWEGHGVWPSRRSPGTVATSSQGHGPRRGVLRRRQEVRERQCRQECYYMDIQNGRGAEVLVSFSSDSSDLYFLGSNVYLLCIVGKGHRALIVLLHIQCYWYYYKK